MHISISMNINTHLREGAPPRGFSSKASRGTTTSCTFSGRGPFFTYVGGMVKRPRLSNRIFFLWKDLLLSLVVVGTLSAGVELIKEFEQRVSKVPRAKHWRCCEKVKKKGTAPYVARSGVGHGPPAQKLAAPLIDR